MNLLFYCQTSVEFITTLCLSVCSRCLWICKPWRLEVLTEGGRSDIHCFRNHNSYYRYDLPVSVCLFPQQSVLLQDNSRSAGRWARPLRLSRSSHESSAFQTEAVLLPVDHHEMISLLKVEKRFDWLKSKVTATQTNWLTSLYSIWFMEHCLCSLVQSVHCAPCVTGCMTITWNICSISPSSNKMWMTSSPLWSLKCTSDHPESPRWPASASRAPQLQLITDGAAALISPPTLRIPVNASDFSLFVPERLN